MTWRGFLRRIGLASAEETESTRQDLERTKRRVERMRFHLNTLDNRLANHLREERRVDDLESS